MINVRIQYGLFTLAGIFVTAHRFTQGQQIVPLQVDVPPQIRKGNWPVTFGVPFPRKAFAAGTDATVTSDGKPIPTQTTPLATWSQDGNDVRWLLVDFQADAAAAAETKYLLVTGRAPPVTNELKMRRDGDRLIIETGAAEFVIRERDRFRIEAVTARGRKLVESARPVRFIITRHDGKEFEASGNLGRGVVVEDRGPNRIGIKSEGWYVSVDGEQFCQHVIRLEFFTGLSTARMLHTFVFTGTSDSDQISNLTVEVPLATGSRRRATFGSDADDLGKSITISTRRSRHLYLVQDHETRFDLRWNLISGETGSLTATGEKAGGWADLSGRDAGVTVALRDAWQNYPYELEAKGSVLHARLWPLHGRLLDFRTAALLAPYGEDGIKIIDNFFKSRSKPYGRSIFDVYNNAMGLAKTHELWLDFHAGPMKAERASQIAQQANTPVLAIADPKWNCRTRALGPLYHFDPKQFPRVEALLEAMFDRFVYWRDFHMDFGWFDYQDIHNDARNERYTHQVAGGRTARLWRYWDSTHYGFPNGPWLLYFRSGKRKYLEFAEANARHCMDIDRCHFGDGANRIRGTHYYCDWSIIHWSGKPPNYVMLSNYDQLEYLLYSYYLSGYRRGLDVMKEYGEAMARFHNDQTKKFPLRMLPPAFRNARHFGPPLGNMIELYRVTWDERYLEIARDYAEAFIQMFPGPDYGKYRGKFWNQIIGNIKEASADPNHLSNYLGKLKFTWDGQSNYARLTGEKKFLDVLKRYATASADRSDSYTFGDLGNGYDIFRDESYLDHGVQRLVDYITRINTSDDPAARGTGGTWACGEYPFSIRSIPVLLAALDASPKEWKKAHLPLLEKNRTFSMAGPRHPTVYVKPTAGRQTKVQFRLGLKQALFLTDPEGKVTKQVEQPLDTLVELSADDLPTKPGSEKVYRISFPLRPTRHKGDYIERGTITLTGIEHSKLAVGPSTKEGHFCIFGPRFYFLVPEGAAQFKISVETSETWALYGWHPSVSVFRPDGTIAAKGDGPGLLEFDVKTKPTFIGKLWSIGPLARISAPKPNKTWGSNVRPFDSHFPQWFKLSRNLPQFVSPHPDLFFIPDTLK